MIGVEEFLDLVSDRLERDLRSAEDVAQLQAVTHSGEHVLQIVAGPGSGKTTVLVLRALRYVFVEDVLPESVLITTFTRKAARELRTRWLDWGTVLCKALEPRFNLDHIDLNRCRIDTLDSIAQQALTDYRLPGTLPPVVTEASTGNLILKRFAFSDVYEESRECLDSLFARYTFERRAPSNRGEALRVAQVLIQRLVQDRVNLASYAQAGDAEALVVEMLNSYRQHATETNVFDFALLEEKFLERLRNGSLGEWLDSLRVVLVDEYQDTNPLQEQIYFALIGHASVHTTIVGDDDQSMYRFRGGSVELFTDFSARCEAATARETDRVDMTRNFRSRPEIIAFYNNHITGDPGFRAARVSPPKPSVVAIRASGGVPVIGMFRDGPESLAADLASFLYSLIDRRRVVIGGGDAEIRMSGEGALGDVVLLAHSTNEVAYDRYNRAAQPRFPSMLRREMQTYGLQLFNPRGQTLRTIPDVRILLGLLLVAIDGGNTVVDEVMPTNEARFFLRQWKHEAESFLASESASDNIQGLREFVRKWQRAALGEAVNGVPGDWPVLEIVYRLISWMPGFQSDPEHQVWLEAITRIIAGAGVASPYAMQLLQTTRDSSLGVHVRRSRLSLVRDALIPIALEEVEVDEDIVPSVPRDRLQLMTIHQAKGLEFPMVIVDVGSRFGSNHHTQRFLRFPNRVSNVVLAEDDMEPHLAASLRGTREGMERTFDDLVRLYYVAYSRPQSVLMLIGHENCLRYGTGRNHSRLAIPNIALGWHRDQTWPWRQPYPQGQRPPVRVNPPFLLVERWN